MGEWISTKTELPEKDIDVLLFGISFGVRVGRFGGSYRNKYNINESEWCFYDDMLPDYTLPSSERYPTHWMLLPEEPKERTTDGWTDLRREEKEITTERTSDRNEKYRTMKTNK